MPRRGQAAARPRARGARPGRDAATHPGRFQPGRSIPGRRSPTGSAPSPGRGAGGNQGLRDARHLAGPAPRGAGPPSGTAPPGEPGSSRDARPPWGRRPSPGTLQPGSAAPSGSRAHRGARLPRASKAPRAVRPPSSTAPEEARPPEKHGPGRSTALSGDPEQGCDLRDLGALETVQRLLVPDVVACERPGSWLTYSFLSVRVASSRTLFRGDVPALRLARERRRARHDGAPHARAARARRPDALREGAALLRPGPA